MADEHNQSVQQHNVRLSTRYMFLIVLGMFAFGFALVPLYQLLCSVTGLNGSTTGRIKDTSVSQALIDTSRLITVEFDATNNANLPWEFYPLVKKVQVHPGEIKEVVYYAKNISDRTIIAQAIPGVTPWQATNHFNKTECFCFVRQKLEPGEAREMPLRFVVDTGLPTTFNTITLSYTFMDTDRSHFKTRDKHIPIKSAVPSITLPDNI